MPRHDLFDLLRLHRQLDGDPLVLAEIIRRFGDADTFFAEVTEAWLRENNFPPAVIEALTLPIDRDLGARLDSDIQWVSNKDHDLVTLWDENYPDALAAISDPPPLLFVRGDADMLATPQIAIVGSRKMTATGRRFASLLAADLARAGMTITSGLALGIDSVAHLAAVELNSPTVAVLACGCDRVYPPRHNGLADRVVSCGALVSELPLGAAPMPYQFPRRNRIVTGLSRGTVVVEAALASGSLISARLAGEQGREVFAVPGSVFGSQSEGCNHLIKTGAKLVACARDVLDEFPDLDASAAPDEPSLPQARAIDRGWTVADARASCDRGSCHADRSRN